jgi:hypothetical protein
MFHEYILSLPQGTLMQFGGFRTPPMNPDNVKYEQLTTTEKAPVLYALGDHIASGGTPIVSALTVAYQNLNPIPSSKKTLLYFTDAALDVQEESDKILLDEILVKYKKAGIRVLFAGLGNPGATEAWEEGFARAAQLCGGEYVVTDNLEDIRAALDAVKKTWRARRRTARNAL